MLNKVEIIGFLGADPEVRYTGSGTAVASIRVATSERWTDKQTGERQERTEWHSITAWGRLAEIAGEYLHKGSKVYFEGSLRTEKYTDKEGVERYTTKIIAQNLIMLDGKREDEGGGQRGGGNGGNQNRGGGGGQRQQQGGNRTQQRQAPPEQGGFEDDDIPF
jgi:single-strand DNA-binding protein